METVNDIKRILDDSRKVLINDYIPQLSEMVTNKVMDIYELGVNTGNKLGELSMLAKVITHMENIGCSDELISKLYNNVK